MRRPVILAALAALMLAIPAWGHSFYPHDCCSDRDCAPLQLARVKSVDGGYMIDGIHFFADRDTRASPDRDYHGCIRFEGQRPVCFWAPKPSM